VARVKYIAAGTESVIELEVGSNLMQGAVSNLIDGIVAECGGGCSCATCHVYIAENWLDKVEAPSDMELAMLGCVPEPKANSRLSCQIVVTEELDGLVVHVPESQY